MVETKPAELTTNEVKKAVEKPGPVKLTAFRKTSLYPEGSGRHY